MRPLAAPPAALILSLVLLLAGCHTPTAQTTASATATATSTASPSTARIRSMVVVGHSGATGWNSDPSRPGDARYNSWATGSNPAVDSIYQRLLPTNPGLRDHAINQAVSGSKVTDLDRQLDAAFALNPSPDLVLIQTVDNDIRCDGTDQENYTAFHDALTRIDAQNPDAATLVVSSPWATVAHYVSVVMNQPDAITVFTGAGPCDLFDPSGHPNRTHMAYQQHVIDAYLTQVQNACRQVRTCHYDRGVLAHLKIDADDLTPDYNHLSIAGQAKQAAVEWAVLEPLVNHH